MPPLEKHTCSRLPLEESLLNNHVPNSNAADMRANNCITAKGAFNHASTQAAEVHDALLRGGYDGGYFIQAGFNTEGIRRGRYMEETYIYLEHKVSRKIYSALSVVFAPFPSVVYTPDRIQPLDSLIPSNEPEDLLHTLLKYSARTELGDSGQGALSTGTGSMPSGSGDCDSKKYERKGIYKSGRHGPPDDKSTPNGPPDGNVGLDGPRAVPENYEIRIPFASTLVAKRSPGKLSIKCNTTGEIDITVRKSVLSETRARTFILRFRSYAT